MDNVPLILPVGITVSCHNDNPSIQLRRTTTDREHIIDIVRAVIHDEPITILPTVRNKMHFISSLIQKGVIIFDTENDQYLINI